MPDMVGMMSTATKISLFVVFRHWSNWRIKFLQYKHQKLKAYAWVLDDEQQFSMLKKLLMEKKKKWIMFISKLMISYFVTMNLYFK